MKYIAKKKTVTKTIAVLKNADLVFYTSSAKRVTTQILTPKNNIGTTWLKNLIPGVIEAFDSELCLPAGYSAVLCENKLFIKHTKETVHIWKISK